MKALQIDSNYDLMLRNGCLAVGDVESQVAEVALVAAQGEFKEHPAVGGDLRRMLGGQRDVMWPARMKAMLRSCGLDVRDIKIDDNGITIS